MDQRLRLMRYRVRTVLAIGSRYDAYVLGQAGLAVEGQRAAAAPNGGGPRCVLAESAERALEVVRGGQVDLVLSTLGRPDDDPFETMRRIKEVSPSLPGLLLTSNPAYHGPLAQSPSIEPFEAAFAWRGEGELLRAIVAMIEDRLNADHDVLGGGVQAMLLVEDEPALYSTYLPMLYEEVWQRVGALTPADATPEERSRRRRARTKVLLARTYEEALLALSRYGRELCGVLTDLQFPKDGAEDPEAGLRLARHVRAAVRESIPVVLQSREREVEARAHDAGAFFVWKSSDHLLRQVRGIMMDYFGFGDFVFRWPDGREVGRAGDLRGLSRLLAAVPAEVFEYHGRRDHFSTWLFIHGEHELARRLRRIRETSEVTRAQAIALIREVPDGA
jgi:CheY-like chemotaxis protein